MRIKFTWALFRGYSDFNPRAKGRLTLRDAWKMAGLFRVLPGCMGQHRRHPRGNAV